MIGTGIAKQAQQPQGRAFAARPRRGLIVPQGAPG
ncbi:hypothetical protein ACTIVE_8494 [Actinomadura verrucosospora]|uniref:Uncharacterized protein n=1 Tax=Actinomadura verrucosospora TaxID=46165 RepID=A0A7D3ZQT1_ACTVE|nr:hypothetical protein ACTIVE_8494 [Actinomadura verrucosospora]